MNKITTQLKKCKNFSISTNLNKLKNSSKMNNLLNYQFTIKKSNKKYLIRNLFTFGNKGICFSCGYLDGSILVMNMKDNKLCKQLICNKVK